MGHQLGHSVEAASGPLPVEQRWSQHAAMAVEASRTHILEGTAQRATIAGWLLIALALLRSNVAPRADKSHSGGKLPPCSTTADSQQLGGA